VYWHQRPLTRNILYTDGAKYVDDHGGTYWLLDRNAFAQLDNVAAAVEAFHLWKLTVNPDATGILSCEDGNYNVVFTKALEYTDFPLKEIQLYFTNNVILLPSEY